MAAPMSKTTWLAHRLLWIFLILCCLGNDKGVLCEDEEEETPISITYNIDKDAEFTCTVPHIGRRKLIWSRLADPYPISIGTTRFAPEKRYRIDRVDSTSYRLTIEDVGVKDAGEYECRLSGDEGLAEIITLNVKGGPLRPYLKQTETEVKADLGQTVILPCEVENLGSKMVLWKNHRNEVISLRKKNHSGDRRFRVLHDLAPQWNLRIEKVGEYDFGYYTCVINSNPVITRTVHLKRAVAPKMAPKLLRDTLYRMSVTAKPGEIVTLTCNYKANPPALVSWYRRFTDENGDSKREELGEGNTLTLRSVRPEQSGTYFCVGKNGLKPYGRGRTRLSVIAPTTTVPPTTTTTVIIPTGPVSPHMYHHMGRVFSGRRGRNVELSCSAIGIPRPYIHWYFQGTRLRSDHKYEVTTRTYDRANSTSTLLVRSLSSRDFGEYRCSGYNQLGVKAISLELNSEL